jgi:hypothetical protein
VDFKVLHKTLGHAEDHVLDEAASGAVEGTVLTQFSSPRDNDIAVFGDEGDSFGKAEVEFALRAFDNDRATVKFDSDFFRKRDWFESDS